jgi:hypothetical protein
LLHPGRRGWPVGNLDAELRGGAGAFWEMIVWSYDSCLVVGLQSLEFSDHQD